MKKVFFAIAAIALLATSCTKVIDKLTTFTFSRSTSFTIPAGSNLGVPFNINSPDVVTNYETEFSNNDANTDKIDYIKVQSMNLSVLAPTRGNFNFVKSIKLIIGADGLSDKTIAEKADVQDGLSILELDASGEDLKPYLVKDAFKLKAEIVTDQLTTQDYEIESNVTFEAKANVR